MAARKDQNADRITLGEDMTIYHAAIQKKALIDALNASARLEIDLSAVGEIDTAGASTGRQFLGKPDIYHALQAELFPLAPGVARHAAGLAALPAPA